MAGWGTALAHGGLRLLLVAFLLGVAIAFSHRMSGFSHMSLGERRRSRGRENLLLYAALAFGVLDALVAARVAGPNTGLGWLIVVFGASPAAIAVWMLALAIVATGLHRFNTHFCRRSGEIARILATPEEQHRLQVDGAALQDLHRELESLRRIYLPGFRRPVERLMARMVELSRNRDRDILLDRARLALRRGQPTSALKSISQWDPFAPETLMLAADCGDWKVCYDCLSEDSRVDRPPIHEALRMEVAQLMADRSDAPAGSQARLAGFEREGVALLHGRNRRIAATLYRWGDIKGATRILSNDWEGLALIEARGGGHTQR